MANNPAQWSLPGQPVIRRAARALFGHPGFAQQTRFVHAADSAPGVALLRVRSGEVTWVPMRAENGTDKAATHGAQHAAHRTPPATDTPGWAKELVARTGGRPHDEPAPATVTLRAAAVLVLLTDSAAGPRVLLTQRAPDLADYPDQLVFPGGAAQDGDRGPVSTALREAKEEVGLDPDSVQIIGLLAPYALTDSGFLVTPVLAWSDQPGFPNPSNPAEVRAIIDVPLDERGGAPRRVYGPMTVAVLDLLAGMLGSGRGPRAVGPGVLGPVGTAAAPRE